MTWHRRALRPIALALLVGGCVELGNSDGGGPGATPAPPADGGPGTADATVVGSERSTLPCSALPLLEAATYPGTSLGLSGFSANGRIQPHGMAASYYFEYGATATYGQRTPRKALPPRLSAHYEESWSSGLGAWRGGSGDDLTFVPSGGASDGFVRYAEPTAYDYNHLDGIGILHLVQYWYPGIFEDENARSGALGGGDPDLRDALVHVSVRGNDWQPHGTELLWWSQVDIDNGVPPEGEEFRYSNWAHTGFLLTDALVSGKWESVDYRLYNDTTDWTYAGTNRELNSELNRSVYFYRPLDDVLAHLNVDLFHLLAFVDPYNPPSGAIDFDDFELTYRNHSLVAASNGGALRAFPPGSADGAAALTDGWRNGPGRMWKSGPSPQAPLEIVYAFEDPVTIERVQLHQHSEWPTKDVEVLVSSDGVTWTTIVRDVVPPVDALGPNFAFLLAKDLGAPARMMKVRILSGYRAGYWGLGEIEAFGSGAAMRTDDDWYRLNADITNLAPGQTYHYRIVAACGDTAVVGQDRSFVVPATTKPEVSTGPATRIVSSSAKLEGRLNTLGAEATVFFEYGADTAYGATTEPQRAGPEITPRTFVGALAGLTPGSTVHYRLVAVGAEGTTAGKDASFVAH